MKTYKFRLLIFMAVFLCPLTIWADLRHDSDGDCDVDGLDLSWALENLSNLKENLPAFAAEFGSNVGCCEVIGTPQDGYPSWHERTVLVFTNMARMAPLSYRLTYMTGLPAEGILERYLAIPPLAWNLGLNRASRSHAEDMAFNCGVRHDSCDGTPWYERIYSYYPFHVAIGENIAAGFQTPWSTVNGLLCDYRDSVCAADRSGLDGHRANIMDGSYTQIGAGFALNPASSFKRYWVQDFGARYISPLPAVYAATHAFIENGATSFLLNYYDPSGSAPRGIALILNGRKYALALDIGSASAGTYRLDVDQASACRPYVFLAIDSDGSCYRYPGTSQFWTYGEGNCEIDYGPLP